MIKEYFGEEHFLYYHTIFKNILMSVKYARNT